MKRVLDEWEPAEFTEMIDNSSPNQFEAEVMSPGETLKDANDIQIAQVEALIETWPTEPSELVLGALRVLAMYIEEDFPWIL